VFAGVTSSGLNDHGTSKTDCGTAIFRNK
jgi:hypothetical protein